MKTVDNNNSVLRFVEFYYFFTTYELPLIKILILNKIYNILHTAKAVTTTKRGLETHITHKKKEEVFIISCATEQQQRKTHQKQIKFWL